MRGGEGRGGEEREEMCLYWREKSLLPSFSLSLSLSFVPDLGLPGGLTGRWKRLYRNNKPWEENHGRDGEMTEEEEEEEKRRSSERSRASTRVERACAHFHHLDGSDLHRTAGKEIKSVASSPKNAVPTDSIFDRSLIRLDSACRCFTL